jgi:hypothetical protein
MVDPVTKLARIWHVCVLFGHTIRRSIGGMTNLERKIDCERQVRDWLHEHGLPQPDEVDYGFTCVRLFFNDPKVVLEVDLDEPPDGERSLHMSNLEQEVD